MTLTDREKWLFILTMMKMSNTGKSMPLEMQQAVCEFLKEKICPSIDYKVWEKMEYDIRDIKAQVIDLMFKGMEVASGKSDLPPEAKKMFNDMDLAKLDSKVKTELKKIDFDSLKKILKNLPDKEREALEPMFESIENLAGDYFKGE